MIRKKITIHGANISSIASFYDEINRVFMAGEDWKIGHSLDAFNDLLYGGFGIIRAAEPVILVWINMEKNRDDLGYEATIAWYREKLESPSRFNIKWVNERLAALEDGTGRTFFEMVTDIISEHSNIVLKEG
ncbi:barstar family protein [Sinomicrobium pectinilyticum]|uniref:barstar family protein n=1 Tax=Sinomicrobium pectinilyticum TaxID=1084421 RepID=UPI001F0BEA80|nr:barstar family protein [Sinomicrobium pectinilyticum]